MAKLPARAAWTVPASLIGWVGIAISAFWLTAQTPFPGTAALLPVGATALLIAIGVNTETPVLNKIYQFWPVRFAGDISYSLYLWHWPLLLLGIAWLGRGLHWPEKILLGVLAFSLAGATKLIIEDWGVNSKLLSKNLRATFIPVLLSMLLVIAGCFGLDHELSRRLAAEEAVIKEVVATECGGYHSLVNPKCGNLNEPVKISVANKESIYYERDEICHLITEGVPDNLPEYGICDYSSGNSNAEKVLAIGDSHVQQWFPAIEEVARQNHWQLYWLLKGGCAMADVAFVNYNDPSNYAGGQGCRDASAASLNFLKDHHFDRLIYSVHARQEFIDDGSGKPMLQQWVEGLNRTWNSWLDAGMKVDVIADSPRNVEVRDPNCLSSHEQDPVVCAVPRAKAADTDPLVEAAKANPRVNLVDMTNYFCDEKLCYASIGGVPVYYDANHLNAVYTRQLVPILKEDLARNHG